MSDYELKCGDALAVLKTMTSESVQCCVTSPPYFGLRDYGCEGQIGLEPTPAAYVARLVEVFGEVWRVLKDDGTLWVNLGDSYASGEVGRHDSVQGREYGKRTTAARQQTKLNTGLPIKNLIGIPWRVAFALQDFGWYLRSDIIWHKPNPMPESVTDRPTKSHEYLFLMTKSPTYYYDAEAIREPNVSLEQLRHNLKYAKPYEASDATADAKQPGNVNSVGIHSRPARVDKQRGHSRRHAGFNDRWDSMTHEEQGAMGRNKRDVWTIAPQNYREAHFATYPAKLVEPCILAGSRAGDTVLDPFNGSGTTGAVALEHGRNYIGIDVNPAYIDLSVKRLEAVQPRLSFEQVSP